MATKKQLAEQIFRKIMGGNPTPDRQIDIREVMLDLDQLRDDYIRRLFFQNMKDGHYDIDQEFLSEESHSLTLGDAAEGLTLNKATFSLTGKPISLPRNVGIQSVYEDEYQKPYIVIDRNQAGFFRSKLSRNVGSNIGVTFKGNNAELITSITPWFLPSIDELLAMRSGLYLNGIGGLDEVGNYWSSTEETANFATRITMYSPTPQSPSKGITQLIRACRSFVGRKGLFKIGDQGISGGYIFYYDEETGTYYEAAPRDLSANVWSNIDNVELSYYNYAGRFILNGSEIGTGISNTYGIVNQAGHTTSAAQDCLDSNSVSVRLVKSSKDILESEEYPLTPDAESMILDALFQKYLPAIQIPHDERLDGVKQNING